MFCPLDGVSAGVSWLSHNTPLANTLFFCSSTGRQLVCVYLLPTSENIAVNIILQIPLRGSPLGVCPEVEE